MSQKFRSTQFRASLRHFCVTRLDLALLSLRIYSLNGRKIHLGLRIVPLETHSRALVYRGKVAQPAHRVKDKRLRRAFGILDTARRLGFMMVKGLLPTPVEQG